MGSNPIGPSRGAALQSYQFKPSRHDYSSCQTLMGMSTFSLRLKLPPQFLALDVADRASLHERGALAVNYDGCSVVRGVAARAGKAIPA